MDISPNTATAEAQRETELQLLQFLRHSSPHIYALWASHENEKYGITSSGHSDDAGTEESEQSSGESKVGAREKADSHEMQLKLARHQHVNYIAQHIEHLSSSMEGLYPSRPWIVYWALQAADLLGSLETEIFPQTPPAAIADLILSCLSTDVKCQAEIKVSKAPDDDTVTQASVMGFAGGPCAQGPHLAASFAACAALVILGDPQYLDMLPRAAIKRWLLTLRNDDGSFRVSGGGESDIRTSYCVAVITTLLALDDPSTFASKGGLFADDVRSEAILTPQTARFVARCQTHEGGFTCSTTSTEAHGAYTLCGVASLILMKQPHLLHQAPLRRWLCARQLSYEGGFNGRTNKLVDSCYSYWIGAAHVLLRVIEAYDKLHSSSTTTEETTDEAPRCLRAREVALLDFVQLLDASAISITDNDCWDHEEQSYASRIALTEQFLAASDDCLTASLKDIANMDAAYQAALQRAKPSNLHHTSDTAATTDAFLYADVGDYYFNQRKLQDYILSCCQDNCVGGLMDKPGVSHDSYHTCYALSGMSAAQNLQYLQLQDKVASGSAVASDYLQRAFDRCYLPNKTNRSQQPGTSLKPFTSSGVVVSVDGPPSRAIEESLLCPANPLFNVTQARVLKALRHRGRSSL